VDKFDAASLEFKDQVVAINRVTKVVKGGKNLSFTALVVVGDENGSVGYGLGKAKEVPQAIKKGIEKAKKNMIHVNLKGAPFHIPVWGIMERGRCCSSRHPTAPVLSRAVRCAP